MKLTHCPRCGGVLRAETVGWMCAKCRGFIDMQGNFHEFTHKPFMPPKTNADRIRAMSDEELADFMTRRNVTESCLRLADEGYTPTEEQKQVLYDSLYPVWMEWLQQPAEGD